MYPPIFGIPAYLIGWLLAAILGGSSAIVAVRRAGLTRGQTAAWFTVMVLCLIVGSRLLYIAETWAGACT